MDERAPFCLLSKLLGARRQFSSQPFIRAPDFHLGIGHSSIRGTLLEGEQLADLRNELLLVMRAQDGDEESFGRLVQPHMRKVFCAAIKITRNREDAEDAAQQAMLNAFLHLHQFRGQSRFSTWLLRIVMNEAVMRVRRRRCEARYLCVEQDSDQRQSFLDTLPAEEASHPEFLYSKAERGENLWKAIEGLSYRLRVVVCALGLQERQSKEAARMLDLSQSAVKTRFLRARQQLRQCLAERAWS